MNTEVATETTRKARMQTPPALLATHRILKILADLSTFEERRIVLMTVSNYLDLENSKSPLNG